MQNKAKVILKYLTLGALWSAGQDLAIRTLDYGSMTICSSLFALLGSGCALVNKDWLQVSLTLLESVHVCKG